MIPASRRAWSKLDTYTGPRAGPGDRLISVTSLIAPPRQVRLLALHRDEIPPPEPGTDTWLLLGTAVHAALEAAAAKADPPPLLVEHRETISVAVDGSEWRLSGQCDVLEADGTLWDYKTTSAYSVQNGGKAEWTAQTNALRWLLERSGAVPRGTIKALGIWAILRDWSASQARRDERYPQSKEVGIPTPLWSEEDARSYVVRRLRLHEAARRVLPECTAEERWAKGEGFAVLPTRTSPRAAAVLESREDAERYIAEVRDGKGVIEYRAGTSTRCAQHCPVASFCYQFKSLLDKR
jgi:hypothetical protein